MAAEYHYGKNHNTIELLKFQAGVIQRKTCHIVRNMLSDADTCHPVH